MIPSTSILSVEATGSIEALFLTNSPANRVSYILLSTDTWKGWFNKACGVDRNGLDAEKWLKIKSGSRRTRAKCQAWARS